MDRRGCVYPSTAGHALGQRCSSAAITYAPPTINRRSTLINPDCGVNRSLRSVQLIRRHYASWAFSLGPYSDHPISNAGYDGIQTRGLSPHLTLNKNRIADSRAGPTDFFRDSKLSVSGYAADLGISKCSSAALKCASTSPQHPARSPITNTSRRSIAWQTSGAPQLSLKNTASGLPESLNPVLHSTNRRKC